MERVLKITVQIRNDTCPEYHVEEMSALIYKKVIQKCNIYIQHPDKNKFDILLILLSLNSPI